MSYRQGSVTIDNLIPKTRKKRKVVPSGMDVFPYGTHYVSEARSSILGVSIPAVLIILVVMILFIVQLIPGIPDTLLRYGAVYYFVLLPVYLLNIFVPLEIITEFYGIGLFFNLAVLAVEFFLVYLIGYNFYACIVGLIDFVCTGNYFIDTIMAILTGTLLLCGIVVCYQFTVVLSRVSGTSRVMAIEYRQM